MPSKIQLLALAVAGVLSFVAGYATRGEIVRTVEVPVVKTETKTEQVVVDHVVTKVVTVTKKDPNDGTVTQTVTKDSTATKTKDTSKDSTVAKSVAPSQPNYSLEIGWKPRIAADVYRPTSAEIGYRVAGPFWGIAGFDWQDHYAKLGLRVEF